MLSKMLTGALGAGILALGAATSAQAATLTVVNANDSGPGSLRSMINAANGTAAKDTIKFAIPGSGVHTITLLSPLPILTQSVKINGYTQNGAAPATDVAPATLKIVIDAVNVGRGLDVGGDEMEIRGLDIQRSQDVGIWLEGSDNVIAGNYIGTGVNGTAARPNANYGIQAFAENNLIGGPDAADRNVISSNGLAEVFLDSGNGHVVQGNYIGTDVSGTADLGVASGVEVESSDSQLRDNLISGETTGVNLYSDDNVVQGNQVGTDLAGTAALGNFTGVNVIGGNGNQIGGTSDGEGNLLSGNAASGLQLVADSAGVPAQDNTIEGNLIGTDASGAAALSNGGFAGLAGVTVSGSSQNTIGGTADGAGNVIAGNAGAGVQLLNADENTVRGNSIGTDATGALDLGNGGAGVEIDGRFNSVGDTGPRAGNTIAHNGEDGVTVDAGAGNAVLRNSIHDNHGLAIDLGADGTTANDDAAHDADQGANGLQNGPVIDSATATDVGWTLESEPTSEYRLEFYANDDCSPTKVTEAQTFLGSTTVSTDANGHADDDDTPITLPAGAGPNISMTATKLDDPRFPTSEVSPCRTIS